MDDKTEAKIHRNAADLFDQLAKVIKPLNAYAAEGYRLNAQVHRKAAEDLDPPQGEWEEGDLVRDCHDELWRYDGSVWRRFGIKGFHSTASLDENFGPTHQVFVSDPTQREVVVSLDGIDRSAIVPWEQWAGCDLVEEVCQIVAKAAREQLAQTSKKAP